MTHANYYKNRDESFTAVLAPLTRTPSRRAHPGIATPVTENEARPRRRMPLRSPFRDQHCRPYREGPQRRSSRSRLRSWLLRRSQRYCACKKQRKQTMQTSRAPSRRNQGIQEGLGNPYRHENASTSRLVPVVTTWRSAIVGQSSSTSMLAVLAAILRNVHVVFDAIDIGR